MPSKVLYASEKFNFTQLFAKRKLFPRRIQRLLRYMKMINVNAMYVCPKYTTSSTLLVQPASKCEEIVVRERKVYSEDEMDVFMSQYGGGDPNTDESDSDCDDEYGQLVMDNGSIPCQVETLRNQQVQAQLLLQAQYREKFCERVNQMFVYVNNSKGLYDVVVYTNELGLPLAFDNSSQIMNYCDERKCYDESKLRFSKSLIGGGREKYKGKKKKYKGGKRRKGNQQSMVVGTQLGVRNPKNMLNNNPVVQDYWRYEEILSTDGSGSLSVFLSLRNPLTAINGAGVYARAQDFAKLYDEYKVLSVGITVDFLLLNPSQGDCFIATDYDTIPSGSYSVADLRDNQYLKIFSGTNQISYMTKVPTLVEGTYRGQPAIIHRGGFLDFNSPPEEGAIVLAFERYNPGTRLVRITSSVKVLMRRRRTLPTAEQRKATK